MTVSEVTGLILRQSVILTLFLVIGEYSSHYEMP